MSCSPCLRRGTNILWSGLVGATFLFCILLVYQFLVHKDVTCSAQFGCSKSSKYTAEKLQSEECISVCDTKECIDISNYILSSIDENADPCNDFYQFACGKFKERYEADGNHSSLERIIVDLYVNIRDIIDTSSVPYGSAMYKLKIVYDSCMNTGSSDLRDTYTLLEFLRKIGIPNWPHLNSNFSFINPTLPELLGKLNTYKEDTFFRFYASHFDKILAEDDGYSRNLTVGPTESTYHEEWEIKELEKAVTSILLHVGLDLKTINKTWEEFIAIESQVHQLIMNNSDVSDACEEDENKFESYSCQQGTHLNRNMLCRVLESVVKNGRLAPRYNKDNLHIVCEVAHYIDRVYSIVDNFSDREIANYIALRVFINNLKNMNFSIRKKLKIFIKLPEENEDDFSAELDKWKYCISWIANNMQYPLGEMYVAKMWPKEAADEVNDLVQEFLDTTIDFLLQQQWIGEATKRQIVKEVKEEENCIYSVIQAMRNRTKINSFYKKFHPTRWSFMSNVLAHKRTYFFSTMFNADDMRYFIEFSPFVVNAYGGENIYLTFGILLPPLFHHSYPSLFNVAKIGQIVGHEIGHKLFYFFEHSTDVDNETRKNFKERIECLIDQYFNFELKRIRKKVQGNQTVSENFPDNMSIKVVEKVSEKYLRNMTSSGFALPGLPYSPEELLYISYAQTWCAVRSVEKEKHYHERDSHSPPEFRIKGALQNSNRFSEVFNCPKTSYMNLEKKCPVFD